MRQDEYYRRAIRQDISYEEAYAEVYNEMYRLSAAGQLTEERHTYLKDQKYFISEIICNNKLKELGYEYVVTDDKGCQWIKKQ